MISGFSFPPSLFLSTSSLTFHIPPSFSPPPFHCHFLCSESNMATSLRIGTSALRSAVAKPVQTAALNGARCYSAKAKVDGPSSGKLN